MNMISLLRERIVRDGETTISAFEFDLLQEEWIRRSKDEDRFDRLRAELEQERERVRELEEVLGVLRGKHGNATGLHIAMSGVIDRIDEALANSEKED